MGYKISSASGIFIIQIANKSKWANIFDPKNLTNRNIKTLFIGVHINKDLYEDLQEDAELRDFWRSCAPIGTRDLHSKKLLDDLGIEAYLSGCLTLHLIVPPVKNRDIAYEVDVPVENLTKYNDTFESFTQMIDDNSEESIDRIRNRNKLAESRLLNIANARRIVSDRLHVYLPSMIFNTPFEFSDIDAVTRDPRFSGLLDITEQQIEEFRNIQKEKISAFISN